MPNPKIVCDEQHASLAVADVAAAAAYYTQKLGFTLGFISGDPPEIAGMDLDRVQIFLERGTPAPSGTAVYFLVGDADALYGLHRDNGVDILLVPADRPWGYRSYSIRDLDGYRLTFGHLLPECEPAIEIAG